MVPDQYLYNSKGEFIAYRIGGFVYDNNNKWIGWLPWDNFEIVSLMGEYLGTIHKDRIFIFSRRGFKEHPGYTDFPGHPGYIEDPGYGGSTSIPSFAKDIDINLI